MKRSLRIARCAAGVLVLAGAVVAANVAQAQVRGVQTQSDAKSAADFELGYSDGRSNLKYRDADRSNSAYADGYKAGQARRTAGVVIPPAHRDAKGRADFELGYRDGVGNLNYRDGDRSNSAYADGYKAGQARRQGSGAAVAGVPTDAKARTDYNLGYADGAAGRTYRDGDRSNKAYADGYSAGQARRQGGVAGIPALPQDPKARADYNLGYADGAANRTYRDGDRSNKAYADGYSAGQARRGGAAVGQPPPGSVRDLSGRSWQSLEPGMQALGYKSVSGAANGPDSMSTWQGPTNSLCVRVVVRGGTIASVEDMQPTVCLSGRSDR
jgi:hypothetical protein